MAPSGKRQVTEIILASTDYRPAQAIANLGICGWLLLGQDQGP